MNLRPAGQRARRIDKILSADFLEGSELMAQTALIKSKHSDALTQTIATSNSLADRQSFVTARIANLILC